jgi:hypothetical protein
MREAGLPILTLDIHGEQALLMGSKGLVRAVYPDTNRVDLETEDGSYLTQVLVIGPYFPEVHKDGEAPSHATYLHVRGQAEAFCWPETHRRLLGPRDTLRGDAGDSQPERRYFHLHGYILRFGEVTVRLTRDNRYVVETEAGDYLLINAQTREIELHAPTVYMGTDNATRAEYQQDTHFRVVMPNIFMGDQALPDTDGYTYIKDTLIHLMAPLIKLTADEIVLDPTHIKLGHHNATERVMLGDLWKAFFNVFIELFNAHQHTNVQIGPSFSGPPAVPAPPMDDSMLSDVTHVSKTGL